ncbi:MAG: LPS export ABC transporter periplasmic protein LptC [Alphaproteobacteria bacterium]|nr:LPS export ABC transporter periplasmic protein LptC [Alphaproteobacteria bacterium]
MITDNTTPPKDDNNRLGQLRPRDTRAAKAQNARYSRTVDVLRWLLPVIVVVGMGVLLLWPLWQDNKISGVMVDNVPNLMVESLNMTGLDEKGHPYALTANRALQAATTKNLIDLEKPKGELTLESDTWVAVHADQGRLDQNTKKLWLGGHVEVFHDAGYRFTSEEINVDIPKSTAWGSQPVLIQGSFGQITGSGFRLLDGGKTMIVTGPAHAKLDLQHMGTSDKDNLNTSPSR